MQTKYFKQNQKNMKQLIFSVISIFALCISLSAQNGVKHQTKELETIQTGDYLAYLTQQDGSGTYEGGLDELVYKVIEKRDYRIQPGVHKEVIMLFRGDSNKPEEFKKDEKMYLPDNPAFPITYIQKVYEGNAEMQKEVGYAPRINKYDDHKRLVFLDGKIYIIKKWVDKDNYKLVSVMEHQAKKMSGFKKMKEVMKSPKKMKEMQPHKTLQNYLDTAFAKQQAVYTQWMKDPNNAAVVEHTELKRKLIIDAINKQRDDWRNSEEYKRIKERNASSKQSSLISNVKLTNRTGKDIYIYEEGSSNGSRISVNSNGNFNCKKNLYYSFSGNSSASKATQITNTGQSCGQTITVN